MNKILPVLAILQVMVCLSGAKSLPDATSNEISAANKTRDLAKILFIFGGDSSSSSSNSKRKEFSFSNSTFTFSNISTKPKSSSSSSSGFFRDDEDPAAVAEEVNQAVDDFQNRKAKNSAVPHGVQVDDATLLMNQPKPSGDSPMTANDEDKEMKENSVHKGRNILSVKEEESVEVARKKHKSKETESESSQEIKKSKEDKKSKESNQGGIFAALFESDEDSESTSEKEANILTSMAGFLSMMGNMLGRMDAANIKPNAE